MIGVGAVGRDYEPVDPLHASLVGLERVRTLLLHHHESKGPARTGAAVGLHQRKPGSSGLPVCPLKVWDVKTKEGVPPGHTWVIGCPGNRTKLTEC